MTRFTRSPSQNLDISLDNMALAMETYNRARSPQEIVDACADLAAAAEELTSDADATQSEIMTMTKAEWDCAV